MSASLVGSEMCIRDRQSPATPADAGSPAPPTPGRARARELLEGFPPNALMFKLVSTLVYLLMFGSVLALM
eukprot:7637761-Alexandrium_andersonii.AAC.1